MRHYTNKAFPLPLIPSLDQGREDGKKSLSLDEGRGWSLPRTPIRGEGEMKLVISKGSFQEERQFSVISVFSSQFAFPIQPFNYSTIFLCTVLPIQRINQSTI